MTEESVTNKLFELFELHKSGAITKEEFEKLKKQILSEDEVGNAEPMKKQEQETVKTPDKPIQIKKGNRIWIFSIIAIVAIVVAVLIFKTTLFSGKSGLSGQKAQTVKDIDGNIYHSVTIGTQIWMAENLKTTKYNDGKAIPLVPDNASWGALTAPAYCWYNNDETANKDKYGSLYNWYTVNTNKLCPKGWHVPTDAEFTTLIDYLTNNGYGYQGSGNDIGKSMAATSDWTSDPTAGNVGNDSASNNSSGFKALPSGDRLYNGTFFNIGDFGYWWSSTEYPTTNAYFLGINYDYSNVDSGTNPKLHGFSVRCLRD